MLTDLMKTFDNEDVKTYIKNVSEGKLYEYIKTIQREKNCSRDELKLMMFKVLFSDNRFINCYKAKPKRKFKAIFPTVYNLMSFIKSKNKNLLAVMLQTIESRIMLQRVAKRITKEKPNLPIFTIHDSVVTLKGNEDYVKQVMTEEVQKAIRVTPTVAVEYWSPNNIKWEEMENNIIVAKNTVRKIRTVTDEELAAYFLSELFNIYSSYTPHISNHNIIPEEMVLIYDMLNNMEDITISKRDINFSIDNLFYDIVNKAS